VTRLFTNGVLSRRNSCRFPSIRGFQLHRYGLVVEEKKSFLLRINPDLWKELEVWAQDELRSVNGQIEYLLKQAVNKRKRAGQSDTGNQAGSR
jgi:hypothetical protein